MRIMRLNFSHATYEEATLRINNLRKSHGVHTTAMGSTFNLRGKEGRGREGGREGGSRRERLETYK
jgi:pyruvate kinase